MMNRSIALVIAVVCLATIGAISAILVVQFHGNDTAILIAAILGFLTPTIASLLTLLQASINAEKTQQVSEQVSSVDRKVDGHLSRLTQIVVDSAVNNTPISARDAAELATHTTSLTGQPITFPAPQPTVEPEPEKPQ